MAPIQLATLAALTPDDIEVQIWDEPVHGLIDEQTDLGADYDLVGITAFSSHLRRARQIARALRKRGLPVAIGGPGVTAAPETCRHDFDILFMGEAELTWPQFIADFKAGRFVTEYRESGLPDLSQSPAPRWDSIASVMKASYVTAGIQVTRGCPYDCEFCGVWQIFGRKMRTKDLDQVVEEVRALERLGIESVLYCSDNFVGNPRYAKEVLRAVTPVNNTFKKPITFATELTIIIERDEEMLELLADANFSGLLIGIETPNVGSLKETRKRQNLRGDLVDQCQRIQSYGVPIDGSMIVGFDHDTTDVFDMQFEFLQEACIPIPRMHMLKAIAGTELRTRMVAEGRVLDMDQLYGGGSDDYLDANIYTNILPMQMTRAELFEGYLGLVERIFDWDNFETRLKGFVGNIKRRPRLRPEDPTQGVTAALKASMVNFPPTVQANINRILDYTEQQAPFMMRSVSTLIIRHFFESARVPVIREEITKQLQVENAMGISSLSPVRGAVNVPFSI